jgi:hypothetical protein
VNPHRTSQVLAIVRDVNPTEQFLPGAQARLKQLDEGCGHCAARFACPYHNDALVVVQSQPFCAEQQIDVVCRVGTELDGPFDQPAGLDCGNASAKNRFGITCEGFSRGFGFNRHVVIVSLHITCPDQPGKGPFAGSASK